MPVLSGRKGRTSESPMFPTHPETKSRGGLTSQLSASQTKTMVWHQCLFAWAPASGREATFGGSPHETEIIAR